MERKQLMGMAASVKAYCAAAKAPDLTDAVMAEIAAALDCEITTGDASTDAAILNLDLLEAARIIRLAGQLPYYTARAIGCYFAARGREVTIADIARECNFPLEVELVSQIADAQNALKNGAPLLENDNRIALLKKTYAAGYYYEKVYRGCAQCTLLALFDVVGNKDPHLFRITNTFAAGMGLFGDGPCGGYSGGLLFLGHYAGRRLEFIDGDKEEKDLCMKLCEMLHAKFLHTYGTITCQEIHKDIFGRAFHIRHADQKEAFEAAGAHHADKCTAVVGTASMWVVEVLLDAGIITA